jgi:hypothetical protein
MPEALTGTPRILNKLVDGFIGNSSAGTLGMIVNGEGWDIIPAQGGTSSMFRWRGYLDLGGLEREALTFFVQSAQVTESNTIFASGSFLSIIDVFSKVEITDDDLNLQTQFFGTGADLPYCPGYNDSVQDMEQVLWGRIRGFYHDAGWSLANLQQQCYQQIWGEGIGTSASRIHLTRYVIPQNDELGIIVPPACFQCVGTAIEEPDLEYIMRLRRDYELATQG